MDFILYYLRVHLLTALLPDQSSGGPGVLTCFDVLEMPLHPSDLGEICHWAQNLGYCGCAGRVMNTRGKTQPPLYTECDGLFFLRQLG